MLVLAVAGFVLPLIHSGWYECIAEQGYYNAGDPNLIQWNNNLVGDFGDNGLWYHNGTRWNWMSNKGHVGQMVVWDGKLVVDFGSDQGIYFYDGAWHWMTNIGDPALMIDWNNGSTDLLVVDFGAGQRIYTYDGSWHWFTNKDGVSDMVVWNNKLVVDFGGGRGVYNYDGSWNWMTNKDDIALMLPWDNGTTERLVVDFGGGRRMYTYDGAWNWFINKDDVNDMTAWNQNLVVDFGAGRGMHYYDGSWHWMTNRDDAARMTAWDNGCTSLAVDFGFDRNMYNYNGSWAWIKNANNVPEMLAWNNVLAVDFGTGVGIYYFNGAWNQLKDWSTEDVFSAPSPVPDTGQTTCYDAAGNILDPCPSVGQAFYGQDACYTINPPSFTKLDAGGNALPAGATDWVMIKDNITGLVWEVKRDDGSIHDKDNIYNWFDANDIFLAQLNTNNFGGYSDWRLPTLKELNYILNYGTSDPVIDTTYFPNIVPDGYGYWSSTTYKNNTANAWSLETVCGTDYNHCKFSYSLYVCAVHGEEMTSSFTDNHDGTVTDNITGLMWAQDTAVTTMTWQQALSWCENLTLAGYDDWRLPTRKELKSIVDENAFNPAIDTSYFPDTSPSFYWSSTAVVCNPGIVWPVNFYDGCSYQLPDDYSYVRAVRGGV